MWKSKHTESRLTALLNRSNEASFTFWHKWILVDENWSRYKEHLDSCVLFTDLSKLFD